MKCMCPNCGNMIQNGKLVFDLTEFMHETLKDIMQEYEDLQEDIHDGRDILFNSWKEDGNKPFVFSEEQLWNYPLNKVARDNKNIKVIDFDMPIEKIKKKINENHSIKLQNQETVKAFVQWLNASEEELKQKKMLLSLFLDGDGDIKFNRVVGGSENINIRKCPYCFSKLSYWAGRYQELTLTVLGGPRVSKSTAVTSCVASFMYGRDRKIRFEGHDDDEGYQIFKENYLERYEKGQKVRATDVNDNIPRVSFRVSIGGNKICLTFVDVPGEFNSKDGIAKEVTERYGDIFDNIDFVWYCTDPGEIAQLTGKVVENELGYGKKPVLSTGRIKANMRELAAYFSHSKRKVPVAYIVGKTDAVLTERDQENYGLYNRTDLKIDLPFNIRAFFERSDRVRRYILAKNPDNLVEEFESLFPSRCYIATSAYGYNPKEVKEGDTRELYSYNCKEIFYWMLALRNCIEVCAENTVTRWFGRTEIHEHVGTLASLSDEVREKAYHNLYTSDAYMS